MIVPKVLGKDSLKNVIRYEGYAMKTLWFKPWEDKWNITKVSRFRPSEDK